MQLTGNNTLAAAQIRLLKHWAESCIIKELPVSKPSPVIITSTAEWTARSSSSSSKQASKQAILPSQSGLIPRTTWHLQHVDRALSTLQA
jgi:hypothetical protein